VHRDVKPANIMFDHDGRVMLTDFGISKALQAASGFTGTGMIIGTPHYMAPEQAKGGQVDGRADQYSLGVVAYRMITGELPYTGDSVHTILYKHIFEEVPRMSGKRVGTPEFLSVAVARALSKEPDQRYATMEEFATAVWPEQPVAVPKKGAATKGQRRPPPPRTASVTADTPTEVTTAPTTPIPRAGMKIPAAKKKRSGMGIVVGAIVLVAVGVGGYLALAKKPAPPVSPPQAGPTPTPPPAAAPVETIRVATQQPPPPPPTRRTNPPPAPPPAAAAAAQGFVSINSNPPGNLFIDGRDLGPVPVIEEPLSVGRHTIRVERAGYKTKTETVEVQANGTVRRTYVLEPEGSE
jgi:serine/threonine protein kinase